MRSPRKFYVDLPDGQVHGIELPGTGPPIVFLHQTASSANSFVPLMAELALANRLIALDTPGFGGSFDPVGEPSLGDYAGWVLAALDRLQVDTAHFFGHHTGACLAQELAVSAPHRVVSVAMAGPVFMSEDERAEFLAHYNEPIQPVRDGSHLLENWQYAAGYNPDCAVELLHQEVTAMLRAWRGRPQAYAAVARTDAMASAARVRCPVLLLTSPGDFFHHEFGRARALLPQAICVEVGGDNFQASADPKGVARAIEAFIASA